MDKQLNFMLYLQAFFGEFIYIITYFWNGKSNSYPDQYINLQHNFKRGNVPIIQYNERSR
ncbi:MAG: hypothetical protein CMC02_03905 [Flavobacteriaceae bacterium]|nr:hypothetical protein [Flavobacteriaceae bacterium]